MITFPWLSQLMGDPLPWLLEEQDPKVRYLTLWDQLNCTGIFPRSDLITQHSTGGKNE